MGNLSLGMQFRTCENFGESTDLSLVLSPKFSQIQKPHRNYFDCDSQCESPTKKMQNAESNLDSADSQNLQGGLPRRFCESARNDEFIIDSSLHKCSAQNDNVGLDSANSQNLDKNNSVRSTQNSPASWCKKSESKGAEERSADFLLEAEKRGTPPKSEKRQLLGNSFKNSWGEREQGGAALLREKTSEFDGEGGAESAQESQSGLPRRFCESARNDEFLDSSLRLRFAQNDNVGAWNYGFIRDSSPTAQNNKIKAENDNVGLDSAILQNQFFPAKKSLRFAESRGKFLPNTALIALGANLKNPIATFKSLFTKLARNAKIHILSTSPIYKNPPFGYANQPFFYNATILLATKMCLLEFYAFIFYLERIFGRNRKRAFKNAPRTLDIDIIFFNDIFMRSKKLNIPHPSWQTRPSVLVPLIFQVHYKGF